jgi:hypothetical protein
MVAETPRNFLDFARSLLCHHLYPLSNIWFFIFQSFYNVVDLGSGSPVLHDFYSCIRRRA